ncbi:hypothetical protein DCC39_10960 [Pueribacillus theae]|uniref:Uncharacterized protein n=1 Tax=Pueribacillus theae TaxID=2171751 RepID=A0A2U1K0I3_9BACI|nr:hypothetical protein [Pueribacillus theae]PWA10679.1 hypothetical protein DCC39_10960 [Pueribacillus theae]
MKQIPQLTFFHDIAGNIASAISIDQSVRMLNGVIDVVVWSFLAILLGFESLFLIPLPASEI